MKATELRIGNYVFTDEIISIILGIYHDGRISTSEYEGGDLVDFIEPIPLTEEWLLKFGGKRDESNDVYLPVSNGIDIRLYLKEDHVLLCKGQVLPIAEYRHIKHIHSIQNLYFALTGEELIIKR